MKTLVEYINEAFISEKLKHLSSTEMGVIVFDIDDTLLRVNKDSIKIYKKKPGEAEIALTTDEFAKDPDVEKHRSWFDYRDFRDPIKVYHSIISGTPLIRNLRIMDSYIDAGYDFCFLTARSCEDVVKQALDDFLLKRSTDGKYTKLGSTFKKTISHAVNDDLKNYPGETDAEKKANILIKLCKEYDKVVFVDDDKKNIRAAKDLDLPNLKVIKAWDE